MAFAAMIDALGKDAVQLDGTLADITEYSGGKLHFPAAFYGAGYGHLIGILKVAADGQSIAQSGYFYTKWFYLFSKVERGSLAFGIGVCREDQLFNLIFFDSIKQ